MTSEDSFIKINKLLDVIKKINSELGLRNQLELIMDSVIEISGAERGFLILLNENMKPTIPVARNMDKEEVQRANLKISHTILNKVLSEDKPIILTDAISDEEFGTAKSVQAQKLRSVCAFPLKTENETFGAIYLDHRFKENIFSDDDLAMLKAFASQVAVAITNARIFEKQSVELLEAKEELEQSKTELGIRYRQTNIIGQSSAMREVFKALDKVLHTPFPVLIYGESGTGKELVAKAIHYNGPRKDNTFIAENCGAIKDSILEAELFGYKKGAFTGADKDKKGLFELANQGTLFLDEIGTMSKEMQESLLRVLQEGEIRPVGGENVVKVDVRLICASNTDLYQLVEDGDFRKDLFFRINVLIIKLPPLREHREDIPILVDHFLDKVAKEAKLTRKSITKKALALLTEYHWPGNVRELENVLRQAVTISEKDVLDENDVKMFNETKVGKTKAMDVLSVDDYIRDVIERYSSQLDHKTIAEKLGISRKTLWEKRKKWGMVE